MKKLFCSMMVLLMLALLTACSINGVKKEYDDQGRLIKEAHPEYSAGYITYEYDENGNLVKKNEYNDWYLFHVSHYENGKIVYSEELYSDGRRHQYFTYDTNGMKCRMDYCDENGEMIEGSYILYTYFENGDWQEESYSDSNLSNRVRYNNQDKPICDEWYADGRLFKSYQYTYDSDGSYQEKYYCCTTHGEVIESMTYYNEEGYSIRKEFYSNGEVSSYEIYSYDKDGNQIKEEVFDGNGLVSYKITAYDKEGNVVRKENYNGAGYLMQESFVDGENVTKNIYSYIGNQRWLWQKEEGIKVGILLDTKTVTCYLSSGEYVIITDINGTEGGYNNGHITKAWYSETDTQAGVEIEYDELGNLVARKVIGGSAYDANGESLPCSEDLLAAFNVVPEYPTE